MTRIFSVDGESIPVTVVHATPNRVTQIKTQETDQYQSVQVVHGDRGTATRKRRRVSKPVLGHLAASSAEPGLSLHEFRSDESFVEETEKKLEVGAELTVEQFFEGQFVDVTGTSKGKGYAGVIKRWNFQRQGMSHGNSLSHRAAGSIGQCQTPGRVFKGKKMAGHMGNERVTVQNLTIAKLDSERNLIMIKGAVPGANGCTVIVRPAVKKGMQTPKATDGRQES